MIERFLRIAHPPSADYYFAQPTNRRNQKASERVGVAQGREDLRASNLRWFSHSDVLVESEELKRQIEVMKLEMEQQRVRQQAATAEAESTLRKVEEENKEAVRRLEANYKSEMENLIAERALAMADSDGQRFKRQVESHKLMIKHLQDQLSEKQVTSDQLAASRVKEQLHRTQMEQLRVELEEAKKNHTQ
ncbi:putative centrosomal protein [Apostichopus japonicus]|uniref:Centrosomal protein of 162 kDa n=1 Tax=Stichopus japonicus TaxID=307972 RepID=A0A2G8JWC4_STIJA|nr:putative centrosomal protein [Apostichopus japonicus]